MTIAIGDKLPAATFKEKTSDGPVEISTEQLFNGKRVVLFAVPGAFTPTCSVKHLPGYKEKNVRLATFLDAGYVWGEGEKMKFSDLRSSVGLAISWDSPVGPLRFSFAQPIKQVSTDKIERFQFQLGKIF